MRVYGPYIHKKMQRRIMILVFENGAKTTRSYARYLMENHLGRTLLDTEEVDHIDGNKLNDDLSNLQILSKRENIKKSAKPAEIVEFLCLWCGKKSSRLAYRVRDNKKQGKEGPFCSKSCAGSWSTAP